MFLYSIGSTSFLIFFDPMQLDSYCISDLRKKKVMDYVPLSVDIGVYDDCLRNDSLKEMYQLICQLDRYERMLVLLWLDENSYDEIASITGSNRNTVAVKLHRIKDKLKKPYHHSQQIP